MIIKMFLKRIEYSSYNIHIYSFFYSSLFPVPCSLFPIPYSLKVSNISPVNHIAIDINFKKTVKCLGKIDYDYLLPVIFTI